MNPTSPKPASFSRRKRRVAKAAALAIAAAGVSLGSATAAHAQTWDGCPDGYVCVTPLYSNTPILKFYTYGAHNLSNVYGSYDVVNNQTGGATANLCLGYNGTNCSVPWAAVGGYLPAQSVMVNVDLTPVNSITLSPPPSPGKGWGWG